MGVAVLLPEDILRSSYSGNKRTVSPKPLRRRSSNKSDSRKPTSAGPPKRPAVSPSSSSSSSSVTGRRVRIPDLDGFYAGSGFAASPPPSSLPMPVVIGKKKVSDDDKGCSELRRILQLVD